MVAAFPPQSAYSVCSPPLIPPTIHHRRCSVVNPRAARDRPLFSSELISSGLQKFPRIINLRCNSSNRDPGENESRTILDAFFLGRALAEALNERIESSVGEFLSTIGRLQAEQQKQIQEFQNEVLEKAKRAKEQAAREAIEAKGLIPKVSAVEKPPVNGVASKSRSATSSTDSSISTNEQEPPATSSIDFSISTNEQDPPATSSIVFSISTNEQDPPATSSIDFSISTNEQEPPTTSSIDSSISTNGQDPTPNED